MFLDDKLYQHTINRQIRDSSDYLAMVNELYKICEDHFKPQLKEGMTYREGRIIMDRVFNSWDLFINRLDKEDYSLVDFMKEASYKSAYMKSPQLVELYNKGAG